MNSLGLQAEFSLTEWTRSVFLDDEITILKYLVLLDVAECYSFKSFVSFFQSVLVYKKINS